MRHFLFCVLIGLSGSALADSLAEANKLLQSGAYGEAFPVLRMLADSGNAEAKLRLGQMYWYGKGLPADRAKADQLFSQAAAAGNQEAAQAMTLSRRRQEHAADIAKWTAYDGADLSAGNYACAQPAIGTVGKTNEEIQATTTAYQAWADCYNRFVADLSGPLAPARRIPADVLALMTEEERRQALARVGDATQAVADKLAADAQATMARYDSWEQATAKFAQEHNALAEAHAKEAKAALEAEQRMMSSYRAGGLVPAKTGKR